jgi:hypothetical protein
MVKDSAGMGISRGERNCVLLARSRGPTAASHRREAVSVAARPVGVNTVGMNSVN